METSWIGGHAAHRANPDRSPGSGHCAGSGDGTQLRAERGSRRLSFHRWRAHVEESFRQRQRYGGSGPLFRTGESARGLRDAVACDSKAGTKRNFVRARERALQINRRRCNVDANHGARTSGRRMGAGGSCRCSGKSRAARLPDCGSQRKRRRPISFGRCGSDVGKSDGGQADRRILVYERNFRRSEKC